MKMYIFKNIPHEFIGSQPRTSSYKGIKWNWFGKAIWGQIVAVFYSQLSDLRIKRVLLNAFPEGSCKEHVLLEVDEKILSISLWILCGSDSYS